MRNPAKLVPVAIFAATLAGAAYAKTATATVTSIDVGKDQITLDNGMTVALPEGIEAETVKIGEHVKLTYSTNLAGKVEVRSLQKVK